MLFIGVCGLLYPSVSQYWNSKTQTRAVENYQAILDSLKKEDYTAFFQAAEEYNSALYGLEDHLRDYRLLEGYEEILNVSGNGIMGYVMIPKLGVELPVYHGISAEVLNIACGHLEGTSLPIGGENTHACISAHSGYPTQKFFDDIDEMKSGDEIYIYVLNRTMKYTVTDKDVVEPDDSSKLEVVQGKDLLTLVTCTPYGINSHRLLIHAERVPFAVATHDSAATISQLTESNYYSSQLQIVIAGFVVIAVVIVKIVIYEETENFIKMFDCVGIIFGRSGDRKSIDSKRSRFKCSSCSSGVLNINANIEPTVNSRNY